ncbi:MAG: hypothetical protein MHMPM18_001970 [Marteilia pararefringens]
MPESTVATLNTIIKEHAHDKTKTRKPLTLMAIKKRCVEIRKAPVQKHFLSKALEELQRSGKITRISVQSFKVSTQAVKAEDQSKLRAEKQKEAAKSKKAKELLAAKLKKAKAKAGTAKKVAATKKKPAKTSKKVVAKTTKKVVAKKAASTKTVKAKKPIAKTMKTKAKK